MRPITVLVWNDSCRKIAISPAIQDACRIHLIVSRPMSKTRIIQIVLLVAIVAAGINFYLTMRERKTGLVVAKRPEVALDPDYYVTPKKLHPQDLKDAKDLTRQPVWGARGISLHLLSLRRPQRFSASRRNAGAD